VKMMQLVAFVTIATLSMSSVAVAGENEERPAMLSALYVSLGAIQGLDVHSTLAALRAGARESNPIAAPFTANAGSMIGLKVVSTATTIFFAERMWKTNRLKAILVLAAINGATAAVAMRNMHNVRAAARR
jgi:Domain of unknown function (DUF5658)